MRKMMKMMLLAIMLVAGCGAAMAQPDAQKKGQRMNREQFAEKQARHIAQTLAFSDEVTKKFVETYCDYQKELWALGTCPKRVPEDASEKEVEKNLKERFAMSEKLLKVRQKYYEKYSKFLTQKQIERVYEMERQMMSRFAKHRKQAGGKNFRGNRKPAPHKRQQPQAQQ